MTNEAQTKGRGSTNSTPFIISLLSDGRPNTRSLLRTSSGRIALDHDEPYHAPRREMSPADYSYSDPLGPAPPRPRTGIRRPDGEVTDTFDDEQFDESLLPE
ncbi:unnamed protein product [Gongylonema pulchrum]|uniref:Ribonucleotide reductase inhibitor n=1 Tax=Gongylonema pulchrum TaxID=637853 RepID=A0A183DXM7_9BILA|nr:unnamed protein product [Gongylonema pulchrum]